MIFSECFQILVDLFWVMRHVFPVDVSDQEISDWIRETKVCQYQEIDCSGCRLVTDCAIWVIVDKLPGLRKIYLGNNPLLTDSCMWALGLHCPGLLEAHLDCCSWLTDSGLEKLVQGCLKLKVISLAYDHNLTDRAIRSLVKHCRHLEELYLTCCNSLTDQSLEAIAQGGRSDLTILDLWGCNTMTYPAIYRVLRMCKHLHSLGVSPHDDVTQTKIFRATSEKIRPGCSVHSVKEHLV